MSRKPLTKTRQPQKKRPAETSDSQPLKQKPEAQPRSKRWPWLIILGLALSLLLGLALRSILADGSPTTSLSPVSNGATATSSEQADWKIVQTFKGGVTNDVEQKTKTFQITGNWRMTWNCKGVHGVDDWLYVTIYNSNGSLYNAGAQITCVDGKQIIGSADEPQGGTFYLAINASTDWTVTVEVPNK